MILLVLNIQYATAGHGSKMLIFSHVGKLIGVRIAQLRNGECNI